MALDLGIDFHLQEQYSVGKKSSSYVRTARLRLSTNYAQKSLGRVEMRVQPPDRVTIVRRHSQLAAPLLGSLRAALLRASMWVVVAATTTRWVWWRLPASIRARLLYGATAAISFSVRLAFTGITRYIVIGVGLVFLLCAALPGVPSGLLELMGFRRG